MTNSNGSNALKVASLSLAVLLALATAATTALAVERGAENKRLSIQVERIVIILDVMKQVDSDLATQIAVNKGERTTEIALINQRISAVTDMLAEIKELLRGR